MCLARILATKFRRLGSQCRIFAAKYMPGPHVFCDFRWYDSSEKGIDGSRSSVEFAVICIESIPAYAGGGSSRSAIPGVCLALLQGSCSRTFQVYLEREGGRGWEV